MYIVNHSTKIYLLDLGRLITLPIKYDINPSVVLLTGKVNKYHQNDIYFLKQKQYFNRKWRSFGLVFGG